MPRTPTDQSDYLSLNITKAFKGIFALCVLLHHVYHFAGILRLPGLTLLMEAPMGYLPVAMFFFFSGYGLWYSYHTKGSDYLRRFPKERILPFYLIVLFLTALYALINLTLSDAKEVSALTLIQSCTWGYTVIKNGWYFQVQLWLYIIFFLTAVLIKCRKAVIGVLAALIAVYTAVCVILAKDVYWYQSVWAFMAGLLWCEYRGGIDAFIKKIGWAKAAAGAIVLFLLLFAGSMGAGRIGSGAVCVALRMAAILCFTVVIALLMMKTAQYGWWRGRLPAFIGDISLGIYAMQGAFLIIFRGTVIDISNGWLFAAAAIAATIVAAVVVTPLFKWIYSVFKTKKKEA